MAAHKSTVVSITPFLIVGTLVGSILALLVHQESECYLAYAWSGLYGVMFLLTIQDNSHFLKLSLTTLAVSYLASIPFIWQIHYHYFKEISLSIISAYALYSFHINYEKNGWRFHYPTLFHAVWDSCAKLFIAFIFAVLCWFIVSLCLALTLFLHMDFLKILLQKEWFNIFIISLFLSIGLFVSAVTQKMVNQICAILLLICRYLFIPLSIIGILFIVALLVKLALTHELFNQHASSFYIQIIFVQIGFLSVLFLNGIYQDGKQEPPYSKWLLQLCYFFLWMTPIFTLLSLYIICFKDNNNIMSNGINLGNFASFLNVFLLLIYNITYAIITWQKQRSWLKNIEKTNIVLAIILIITTLVTTNPFFIAMLPASKNNILLLNPQEKIVALNDAFKNTHFAWKKNIDKNALILGYNQKPVYFCRTKHNGVYQGGIIINHQCHVIVNNRIMKTSDFTVLSGPADKIAWDVWKYYVISNHRALIIFDNTIKNPAGICRMIYHNRIVVGVSQHNNQCQFIANNQVVTNDNATQFLYLKNKI